MIKYYTCLNSEILTEGENDGRVYKLDKTVTIQEYKTCDTLATVEPQEDGCLSFKVEKDYGEVAFVGVGYCAEDYKDVGYYDGDYKDKSNVVKELWLMTEEEANADLKRGPQGDFDCYYRVCKEGFVIGFGSRFVHKGKEEDEEEEKGEKGVQTAEQNTKGDHLDYKYKYVDNDCFDIEYGCGTNERYFLNNNIVNITAKPTARGYKLKRFDLTLDAQTYFDVRDMLHLNWNYVPIFYKDVLVGYGCFDRFKIFGSFSDEICLKIKIKSSYSKDASSLMVEYLEINCSEKDREKSNTNNVCLLWCEVEDQGT